MGNFISANEETYNLEIIDKKANVDLIEFSSAEKQAIKDALNALAYL